MNLALKNACDLRDVVRAEGVTLQQTVRSALTATFGRTIAAAALALPTQDERQDWKCLRGNPGAIRVLTACRSVTTLANKSESFRRRATAVLKVGALAESKVLTDLADVYSRAARVARNEQRRSATRMTSPATSRAAATL